MPLHRKILMQKKPVNLFDLVGNEVNVGDEIAMAFTEGRSSATLRVGVITDYTVKETEHYNYQLGTTVQGDDIVKIMVQWDKDKSGATWSLPDKPTLVTYDCDRIIKL